MIAVLDTCSHSECSASVNPPAKGFPDRVVQMPSKLMPSLDCQSELDGCLEGVEFKMADVAYTVNASYSFN